MPLTGIRKREYQRTYMVGYRAKKSAERRAAAAAAVPLAAVPFKIITSKGGLRRVGSFGPRDAVVMAGEPYVLKGLSPDGLLVLMEYPIEATPEPTIGPSPAPELNEDDPRFLLEPSIMASRYERYEAAGLGDPVFSVTPPDTAADPDQPLRRRRHLSVRR
jgi:hypothetical protein